MAHPFIASVIGTFVALFPITNPIGAVPIFYSLVVSKTPSARGRQARQVAFNAVLILVVFFLLGRLILDFFGISLGVIQIAGGLLVGQTAWKMMSGSPSDPLGKESMDQPQDISLIPMAIPLVSGPGAIGMAIALATQNSQLWNYLGSLMGIVLLGATIYLCLALGEPLIRMMGRGGLKAFNQVLGFFILAIAIQLVVDGLKSVV